MYRGKGASLFTEARSFVNLFKSMCGILQNYIKKKPPRIHSFQVNVSP